MRLLAIPHSSLLLAAPTYTLATVLFKRPDLGCRGHGRRQQYSRGEPPLPPRSKQMYALLRRPLQCRR